MELMDVLRNRRAVRSFTDASIDRPTIERLIGAAVLAPSARNLQPWAFAACVDRARITQYSARARQWFLDRLAGESYDRAMGHLVEDPEFELFHGAPALVLVLATSPEAQAAEDCCLAAENLMLAARDQGLGTCWIGFSRPWLDLPETKAELGVNANHHVVAPIIVGHPTAWPPSHARKKPEIRWIG